MEESEPELCGLGAFGGPDTPGPRPPRWLPRCHSHSGADGLAGERALVPSCQDCSSSVCCVCLLARTVHPTVRSYCVSSTSSPSQTLLTTSVPSSARPPGDTFPCIPCSPLLHDDPLRPPVRGASWPEHAFPSDASVADSADSRTGCEHSESQDHACDTRRPWVVSLAMRFGYYSRNPKTIVPVATRKCLCCTNPGGRQAEAGTCIGSVTPGV